MRRVVKPECKAEYEAMMLPVSLWGADQQHLPITAKATLDKLIDDADSYCRQGYVMVIYGGNGSGKSSAAAVVAKKTMETGIRALWSCPGQLRDAVRWDLEYSHQRSYLFHAQQVSLLIIDDLVASDYDERLFAQKDLRDLLRRRSANGKSTIITTGMDPSQWKWIHDTLSGVLVCVDAGTEDRRGKPLTQFAELPAKSTELAEDDEQGWMSRESETLLALPEDQRGEIYEATKPDPDWSEAQVLAWHTVQSRYRAQHLDREKRRGSSVSSTAEIESEYKDCL